MHPKVVRRFRILAEAVLVAILSVAFDVSANFTPAHAGSASDAPLCGDGSAPDYGFTYDLQQPHWTVGWKGYVSPQTVDEVDAILDRLNEESITQTMILIKPQEEVGIRPNCAVHFLRYMKLGLPSGERKDNGFVFLIVLEKDSIDVHYAVGLGLPALTAYELTNVNRAAENTYKSTQDMDQAMLALVDEYDKVARDNYPPLSQPESTPEAGDQPYGPVSTSAICGQLCLGALLLLFLLWIFSQMGRGGGGRGGFYPGGGSRSWGRGGGFSSGGFSSGGGRSSPPSRGGSGSGRSGRTN